MVRLMSLTGVRLIERCIASGDEGMIPARLSIRAFADHVALVHFGTTEADLFPEPLGQDVTDSETLQHEARTEKVLGHFKSDLMSDQTDIISFFLKRGFDVTDDQGRLAKCSILFSRLIEAGHLGWLGPCPCESVERWRRTQMQVAEWVVGKPANDDLEQAWAAQFGAVA